LEERFVDLTLDDLGKPTSCTITKRMIQVSFDNNKTLRFVRRGLTQFLHELELRRRDLKHLKPEDVLVKWYDLGLNTVFSAFRGEDCSYVVYRVTSDKYVPIPHRVLFEHVDQIVRMAGIDTKYEVTRYFTRTAAKWLLWSCPLNYARVGDALNIYLYVSNANTGNDSIKVFGYGEILKCANGLTVAKGARIRVIHVKDVQGILKRVADAVREVMVKLEKGKNFWVETIERLQRVELRQDQMKRWINDLLSVLPKKYHGWFYKYLNENVETFGATAEALFQTVTALVPRVRNQALHGELDKRAHEIISLVKVK
jgi:hypothetical protein